MLLLVVAVVVTLTANMAVAVLAGLEQEPLFEFLLVKLLALPLELAGLKIPPGEILCLVPLHPMVVVLVDKETPLEDLVVLEAAEEMEAQIPAAQETRLTHLQLKATMVELEAHLLEMAVVAAGLEKLAAPEAQTVMAETEPHLL